MISAGLYSVAISIGNADDITLRALEVLQQADAVICEELRNGMRLLKAYGIDKPIFLLNEHSTKEDVKQLFDDLLIRKKKAIALISDAGTPGFADPGAELIQICHEYGVPVYPVPGASSLMAALMVSGMRMERFLFSGFLPAKREERIAALQNIKLLPQYDIILMEAPYRLPSLLDDMIMILGKKRRVRLFYKLTQPEEKIFLGTLEELKAALDSFPKGEFILVMEHERKS